MRIRSRNKKASIVSIGGALIASVWSGYDWFTTAAQLPADARKGAAFFADPPSWLPPAILVLCILVLAWSLWPWGEDDETETTGVWQETHGPSSHAFAGDGPVAIGPGAQAIAQMRDMIVNHPPPAAQQPVKTGHWARHAHPEPQRVPETKGWEAIEYVARVIGDRGVDACYPDARRALRQAALICRVRIWGRKERAATHMQSPEECVEVWTEIERHYWEDWIISEMALGQLHDERPHTKPEPHVSTGLRSGRYWALRIDEKELRAEWSPRRQLGIPSRDVSLAAGLVYALTGSWELSVLDTLMSEPNIDGFNYRKREFERDASAGRLTVWGRERVMNLFADDTWDLIEPNFWSANKVSWDTMVLGDTARTESRSGSGNADQYEDLMISKAEFEERWPTN